MSVSFDAEERSVAFCDADDGANVACEGECSDDNLTLDGVRVVDDADVDGEEEEDDCARASACVVVV